MTSARPAPNWIVLGSGRSANLGVGNKARLLDLAARAGLPVPAGVVVLDDAWHAALRLGLLRREAARVEVGDAARLLARLDLPAFARPIAVRSAFALEDAPSQSLAGYFTSRLGVNARDQDALATALADVWGSADRAGGNFRRDVLLLQMVDARHAGVAFSEQEHEDDLVNVVAGTADRLVSGAVAGDALLLPKLRLWERPPGTASLLPNRPFALRLQRLLRDIRRVFGPGDWDVEWADDGERCWLIQLRPVTRPTRRDEAFTLANHKEILPELPSRFMATLVESCADRLFANYRHFDPSLPAHRPFIESFLGRPYINLSLLSEMMRVFGLPTRLVTDSIGGETDRPAGPNVRGGSCARRRSSRGWAWPSSPPSSPPTSASGEILRHAEQPGDTFSECVATLAWLYTALVGGMMSLTAAMSGPLAILRALGVQEEHTSRHRTVATAIYDDLAPLRALVHADRRLLDAVSTRRGPDRSALPGRLAAVPQAPRPSRHLRERHRPPPLPRGARPAPGRHRPRRPAAPRVPSSDAAWHGYAAALVAVQPGDARPRELAIRRDGRLRAGACAAAGSRRRRRDAGRPPHQRGPLDARHRRGARPRRRLAARSGLLQRPHRRDRPSLRVPPAGPVPPLGRPGSVSGRPRRCAPGLHRSRPQPGQRRRARPRLGPLRAEHRAAARPGVRDDDPGRPLRRRRLDPDLRAGGRRRRRDRRRPLARLDHPARDRPARPSPTPTTRRLPSGAAIRSGCAPPAAPPSGSASPRRHPRS